MSVQKFLDKIKNGRYGADITDAIIGGIKKCYDDASVNHDNANMEVKMARGTHNTLNDRLDKSDEIQAQTNAQLSDVETHTSGYVNLKSYSHLVVNNDWTEAIKQALRDSDRVEINHDIEVLSCISISSGKSIKIGSCTISKPARATNTDPIFRLAGNCIVISGDGYGVSNIKSYKESPNGVVKVGHLSTTTADCNANYNCLKDITITGNGIAETNVALHLLNAELNGLASYFSIINNVMLQNAGIGILFEGYANANILTNIHLYQVGGSDIGGGIYFKGIGSKVPMENSISNVFHHASSNAKTLVIDCNTFYNKISHILSEQGGTGAYCLYVTDNGDKAFNNYFNISPNVNQGDKYSAFFAQRNTIHKFNGLRVGEVGATRVTTSAFKTVSYESKYRIIRSYHSITPMSENEKVKLFTINNDSNYNLKPVLLTVRTNIYSSTNVESLIDVGETKLRIKKLANTSPTITTLSEIGVSLIVENGEVFYEMPNNGTNTSKQHMFLEIEFFGLISNIESVYTINSDIFELDE